MTFSKKTIAFLVAPFIIGIILFHLRHKIINLISKIHFKRRTRYLNLDNENSFFEDLEDGLNSESFDITSNISNGDPRKGLLEVDKKKVKQLMKVEGLSFDDARLKVVKAKLEGYNIGEDGVPLDPKTVTFGN